MTMLLECWQFSGRVSFSVRFTFPEAQNRKGSSSHFSSQDEIEVWFEVRLFLPAVLSFSRRTESRVQGEQSAPTQLPFCFLPSLFLVTSHSSLFLVTSHSSLFLVTSLSSLFWSPSSVTPFVRERSGKEQEALTQLQFCCCLPSLYLVTSQC